MEWIIKNSPEYYKGGDPNLPESWSEKAEEAKKYSSKDSADAAVILGYINGDVVRLLSDKDPISIEETIQDLNAGETVIYRHSSRSKVTCEFIAYMDHGFTAHLKALDGPKKGKEFVAWMNKVARK